MSTGRRSIVSLALAFGSALILTAELRGQMTTEFSVAPGNGPLSIIAGPDGYLWFTQISSDGRAGLRIGRMSPGGTYSELGTSIRGFHLANGPDGAVWITSSEQNSVIRLTPEGTQTAYPLPSVNSGPLGIARGSDGNLWFVERPPSGGGRIGRITPAGAVTKFPLQGGILPGTVIVPGPDGALWFTGTTGLFRITTAGTITQVLPPTIPAGFVWGPDGRIWFNNSEANAVSALEVGTGAVQSYVLPTPNSFPSAIMEGPDGNLWVMEPGSNRIGRVTTSGEITEFPLPTGGNLALGGIVTGPDGNVWFTEPRVEKVGRLSVATLPCVGNATTLCLNGGRFRVRASYDSSIGTGSGKSIGLTSDTGYFWFFSANNVEIVVKVVNGCAFNQSYWVFAGGLTNVGVDLTVTDTETGASRIYRNPANTPFPPLQKTGDFAVCSSVAPATAMGPVSSEVSSGPNSFSSDRPQGSNDGSASVLEPGSIRVFRSAAPAVPCVSDFRTLCLNNGRFQVRAFYDSPIGSGDGNGLALTSDTGYFWFFSANNVEIVVKVVDGCSFNQNYWVFAAGLTNVRVDLTVTDSQTGITRAYTNLQNTPYQPLQQTGDFSVCP